jgi:predicted CopG family antitoxin
MIIKNEMPAKRLNVTISEDAYKKAEDAAASENRSLSNMIDTMIKEYKKN